MLGANATLGRSTQANGVGHELPDERMSKEHATVRRERGACVITDLESRNGTFVDGERVLGSRKVSGDAIVRLGHTVFALLAVCRLRSGEPERETLHGLADCNEVRPRGSPCRVADPP